MDFSAVAVTSTVSQRAARPFASRHPVGISVDLGAGPQDQLPVLAMAKFVESEIDGRGDAVGGDRPYRHPLALVQEDLMGAVDDVGVGSHIEIPRRPDISVAPR